MNSPSIFARFIHEKGAREDQKAEMLKGEAIICKKRRPFLILITLFVTTLLISGCFSKGGDSDVNMTVVISGNSVDPREVRLLVNDTIVPVFSGCR